MASKRDIRLIIRTEIEKALKDIENAERKLDDLDKKPKSLTSSFTAAKSAVAGFVAALAIRQVAAFTLETSKLYGQVRNMQATFKQLAEKEGQDSIKLFKDLQKATGGTVDRIKLLQNATQARFLGVDMKNLPTLFEFARIRAKETGQEVDYLVESIVGGIGRKSPLILDNLGLQMSDINNEIIKIAKETGTWNGKLDENIKSLHLQEAAVRIAKQNINDSAGITEDAADQTGRLNAAWTDFKILIGAIGDGPVGTALGFVNEALENMGLNIDKILATGLDKEILILEEQLTELKVLAHDINRTKNLNFAQKQAVKLRYKVLGLDDPFSVDEGKLQQQIDELETRIADKRAQKQKEIEDKAAKERERLEAERQKKLDEVRKAQSEKAAKELLEIEQKQAELEFQIAVEGAQNQFQAKLIALDNWREKEVAGAKGNAETLALIDEAYALRRKEIAGEIEAHNLKVMSDAALIRNEQMIADYEREQETAEKKKQVWNDYAVTVANVMQGPMELFMQDMILQLKSGRDAWKGFLDAVSSEMSRFLASQAVNGILKLLFNLAGGSYTAPFSFLQTLLPNSNVGLQGNAMGAFVPKRPGGSIAWVGEGGDNEVIIPEKQIANFIAGKYALPGGYSIRNVPAVSVPGSRSVSNNYDNRSFNNGNYSSNNNSINFNGAIMDGQKLLKYLKSAQMRDLNRRGNANNRESFQ